MLRPCVALAIFCFSTGLAPAQVKTTARENLAPNPSFEDPDGAEGTLPDAWNFYPEKTGGRFGITQESAQTGKQALRIKATGALNGSEALLNGIDVQPGDKFTFSAYVRNSKSDPMDKAVTGMLAIEWTGAYGKEIGRLTGKSWDSRLAKNRWIFVSIDTVEVPKGCTRAVFGVHLTEAKSGGKGSFLVDDVSIVKK